MINRPEKESCPKCDNKGSMSKKEGHIVQMKCYKCGHKWTTDMVQKHESLVDSVLVYVSENSEQVAKIAWQAVNDDPLSAAVRARTLSKGDLIRLGMTFGKALKDGMRVGERVAKFIEIPSLGQGQGGSGRRRQLSQKINQ